MGQILSSKSISLIIALRKKQFEDCLLKKVNPGIRFNKRSKKIGKIIAKIYSGIIVETGELENAKQ